jgi:hypothetical protein
LLGPIPALACDFDVLEGNVYLDGGSIELKIQVDATPRRLFVDNSIESTGEGRPPVFYIDGVKTSPRSRQMREMRGALNGWMQSHSCENAETSNDMDRQLVVKCLSTEGFIQFLDATNQ